MPDEDLVLPERLRSGQRVRGWVIHLSAVACANSTYDLRIVPAVPRFRNWNVTITCDNGTRTQATTYF
jgi:hypothetical protein